MTASLLRQKHPHANPRSESFLDEFGRYLRDAGVIDELAMQRSQRAARQTGERFDQVLTKLGLISEPDLYARLAGYLGRRLVEASEVPSAPVATEWATARFVRANRVLPIARNDDELVIGLVDPFDLEPADALAYASGLRVSHRLMQPAIFEKALATIYSDQNAATSVLVDARVDQAADVDLERLRDIANEAPVIRRVNHFVADAIEAGASDIHVEPRVDGLQIRYRVDGALRAADVVPPGLAAAIASRLKIMAGLDIAERRLPQDGRVKLAVRGVDIDFRVSTIPTAHGESIVMRVLDRSRVTLDFSSLGFEAPIIDRLRSVMNFPNGIALVTGPTGSGKTTTLYTMLKELNRPELKIFSVEDPIEYQLPGVNQVQVHPAIGLDFPRALRSILRQDPDVIMIGEIRDAETARIAIQAALTGHLVLSTLHTNGAAASITRLIDMGIESFLIASTLKAVLAQRLVRRLCIACRKPMEAPSPWIARASGADFACGPHAFSSPSGCARCRQTGYAGRTTISEFLVIDDRIRRLVSDAAPEAQIDETATTSGMRGLFNDGLAKAWRGETSVDEVLRATRME